MQIVLLTISFYRVNESIAKSSEGMLPNFGKTHDEGCSALNTYSTLEKSCVETEK